MSSMRMSLLPSRKLLQLKMHPRSTGPARSAVHPSRRKHCSAISAVHSCNPIDPAAGRRSPQGSVLFLWKQKHKMLKMEANMPEFAAFPCKTVKDAVQYAVSLVR